MLQSVKTALSENSVKQQQLAELKKRANLWLTKPINSVVAKRQSTPCGNPHEYMSMASYYWPDSSKPDGLPYIRKDGQRNPANDLVPDHTSINEWITAVSTLGWAYYFTSEEKYAQRAVSLLTFWCIDTATYMIPNLNHAQIIRGIDTGRGIGIIDIHLLPNLMEATQLLENYSGYAAADKKLVKAWFANLLNWLRTSENGRQEMQTKNNHKTYYELLTASLAIYVGEQKSAQDIFQNAKKLLLAQIDANGLQALETDRTNGLSYSIFNLSAWFQLATLAAQHGVDLWNYPSKENARIQLAINYVLPYVTGNQKWPFQQINALQPDDFFRLLNRASLQYPSEQYESYSEKAVLKSLHPLNDLFYR
ncbi:MAG: alginate lyase family protein [Sediminibacterium sp.]|nr:alginate lyase family protein [Sediminibacterium sp.]